jgi:hypothetical protein
VDASRDISSGKGLANELTVGQYGDATLFNREGIHLNDEPFIAQWLDKGTVV